MSEWSTDQLRPYVGKSAKKVPQAAASVAWRCGDRSCASVLVCEGSPITTDSRFPVWSITKTFMAVAVLRLVARRKIGLDARISEWFPAIAHADVITIRHCLQHTSGWPDYGGLPDYHASIRRGECPWTFLEFLQKSQIETLLFEPGAGWSYSNIGYMILRKLMELECGIGFAEVIEQEVCRPLGLTNTSVISRQSDLLDMTPGYSFELSEDGLAVDVRARYNPDWVSTGVIGSTASEIVRFYHGLFSHELLPPDLLSEMCKVVRVEAKHPIFMMPSYGLGLMADPDFSSGPVYGHNGAGPGYAASAFHFRRQGAIPVTVAVLTNTEHYDQTERMALHIGKELTSQNHPPLFPYQLGGTMP